MIKPGEFLECVYVQVHTSITDLGYAPKSAKRGAQAAFDCIHINFQGRTLYIPQYSSFKDRVNRARDIYEGSRVTSPQQLAREYRLSMPRIYKILREQQAIYIKNLQLDLIPTEDDDHRQQLVFTLEEQLSPTLQKIGVKRLHASEVIESLLRQLDNRYLGMIIYMPCNLQDAPSVASRTGENQPSLLNEEHH